MVEMGGGRKGGSFLHLYGLFWKFFFKETFLVFDSVKKYRIALKAHRMYFKVWGVSTKFDWFIFVTE